MIKNRRKIENFVLKNAAIMTVSEMARVLSVSPSTINRILKKKKINKRKIYSRTVNAEKLNPNPPTTTTYMLVCRYNYEGLSMPEIANILNRDVGVIDFILADAISIGVYWKFNYYNRPDEEKEKIRLLEQKGNYKKIKKNQKRSKKEIKNSLRSF